VEFSGSGANEYCNNMKVSIVIPAFNEELTIEKTIKDYSYVFPDAYFCIIDNNSQDNTYKIASRVISELNIKGIIKKESRQGKAFAIRSGLVNLDSDYYIMTDADCTYPASEAKKCLDVIIETNADIVTGDRHSTGAYKRENKRSFHNFGNMLVKYLIKIIFKTDFRDILTGLRVFDKRFAKNYPILCNGFELETDMTLHIIDKRLKITEVPIIYQDRPHGSFSKLNTFKDGFNVIRLLFKVFRYYKPLQFFSIFALILFVCGLMPGLIVINEFLETKYIKHVPSAILASALMICSLVSFTIGLVLDNINRRFMEIYEQNLSK
jgi:glycosyltransferase involved in cell wall biosynthesis